MKSGKLRRCAEAIKAEGLKGIIYPSVSNPGGACISVFSGEGAKFSGRKSKSLDVFVGK